MPNSHPYTFQLIYISLLLLVSTINSSRIVPVAFDMKGPIDIVPLDGDIFFIFFFHPSNFMFTIPLATNGPLGGAVSTGGNKARDFDTFQIGPSAFMNIMKSFMSGSDYDIHG